MPDSTVRQLMVAKLLLASSSAKIAATAVAVKADEVATVEIGEAAQNLLDVMKLIKSYDQG